MILKAALIGVVIAATFGMGLFTMADIPDRINDISLDWGRGECMDEDYGERHGECEEHYDESEDSSNLRGSIHSDFEECEHLEEGEEICEEHDDESEDSSDLRGNIHSDGEECEELEEEHCWEDDEDESGDSSTTRRANESGDSSTTRRANESGDSSHLRRGISSESVGSDEDSRGCFF